jgi:putative spermidine/putrescine transport system substrate-binding protein
MSSSESDNMRRMNRRQFVRNAGLAGVGLTAMGALAACGGSDSGSTSSAAADTAAAEATTAAAEVAAYQGTLKVVGLGVDLIDPIKAAFEAATPGVTLEFTVKSTPECTQIALTQPDSLDILSGYYQQTDQVWPSGNFMAIPTSAMTRYSELSPLITKGAIVEGDNPGQGDAAFRKLYATSSTELSEAPTDFLTCIPGNNNADSFGYNVDELGEQDSWAILVDPQLKGKVALIDDPTIGLMDAAMAVEANGDMTFVDKGNMTKAEIDELMTILIGLKKAGQFRGFWATFDESVNFMSSGEVLVESMWSPAVSLLQAQAFPVRYAAPKEGYRGWGGGNMIASHVEKDPSKLAACLAYANWWNTPEPAGIMAAQGYYNGVMAASHDGLLAFPEGADYDGYYLNGQPATGTLNDPFGQPSIKKGDTRDGGSYEMRCGNFNTWNSYMTEADYVNQKWQEFKSA